MSERNLIPQNAASIVIRNPAGRDRRETRICCEEAADVPMRRFVVRVGPRPASPSGPESAKNARTPTPGGTHPHRHLQGAPNASRHTPGRGSTAEHDPGVGPPGTGNSGPIGALRYPSLCNRGVTETGALRHIRLDKYKKNLGLRSPGGRRSAGAGKVPRRSPYRKPSGLFMVAARRLPGRAGQR